MMDQITMCKKSQEVTSKNNDVNKELSKTKPLDWLWTERSKLPTNVCPPRYLPVKFQFTIFWPLTAMMNISRKRQRDILVRPLPNQYERKQRSWKSWWWKSTRICKDTLEILFRGCRDKYYHRWTLSQGTLFQREYTSTSSGWMKN